MPDQPHTPTDRPRAVAFFDVDGTLVWHPTEPPSGAGEHGGSAAGFDIEMFRPTPVIYDAFARMAENGHKTFICTGRPYHLLDGCLLDLDPAGVVCEAGAYVRVGDAVVRDVAIPFEDVMEAAEIMWEAGVNTDFEGNAGNIALYREGEAFLPHTAVAHSLKEFEDLARGARIAKFCTHFVPEDLVGVIRPRFEGRYTVCDMQMQTFEFSPLGVDKASGIRAALDYLGHGRAGTFAFGDSENDLSMRGAVDTFVAMGNALPSVKDVADYVTDDVREDGVATGLRHFGLIS